jgi:hypothetical protein
VKSNISTIRCGVGLSCACSAAYLFARWIFNEISAIFNFKSDGHHCTSRFLDLSGWPCWLAFHRGAVLEFMAVPIEFFVCVGCFEFGPVYPRG